MAEEMITPRQSVTDVTAFPPLIAAMARLEQAGPFK